MKARAIALGIGLILAVQGAGQAQAAKNFLFLSGGAHYHFQSGETGEYVLGENDFPVIPAHTGFLLGFSYLRTFGKMFGAEIDARFVSSSHVVLTDPSDGDTVEISAGPHASFTVSALFAPFPWAVRPYLLAGGGLDVFLAGDASYTSRYGYVIDVPAPAFKERFDPEAHVGVGVLIVLGKRWGFRLESRYGWIFDRPRTLSGISGSAGVFLSF
ncbi:MAG: hypothetical protein NTW38_03820 [Candidatus Aminicenantes bacterium]|nr:hypothetical protein [Candidatus Aminicenantes bacterium]